jgi:predicted nucleic-acid-binding protein
VLIAVDTNIIIRLAMRDDETQYQKVIALLKEHQFFISRTVQLETEWVLRLPELHFVLGKSICVIRIVWR